MGAAGMERDGRRSTASWWAQVGGLACVAGASVPDRVRPILRITYSVCPAAVSVAGTCADVYDDTAVRRMATGNLDTAREGLHANLLGVMQLVLHPAHPLGHIGRLQG